MYYWSGRLFANLRRLLQEREFVTVAQALENHATSPKYAIFRVDIERRLNKCLRLAKHLHSLGINGTFYAHTRSATYRPKVLRAMQEMGHEIAYHFECLDRVKGDFVQARDLFLREAEMFRQDGFPIRTATGHGEVGLQFVGYSLSSDLLDRYPTLMSEAGLLGGPHDWIREAHAVSATDKFSDLRNFWGKLKTDRPLHILTHWHRWSAIPVDSGVEVGRDLWQYAKNRAYGSRRYDVVKPVLTAAQGGVAT